MTNLRRSLAAVSAAAVLALTGGPVASASADGFCADLGGSWDGGSCTAVIKSDREAEMLLSLRIPAELLDSPVMGPVLRDYYQRLFNGWRATGNTNVRDSSAYAGYDVFTGPGGVQSVIVHETYEPFGLQANNAFRAFVFDTAGGRRLLLRDLFRPGVDPFQAVAAAAAPVLPATLDAAAPPHAPGTYPFTVAEFQPDSGSAGYSGDYKAFALTQDSLLLYMPDQPMPRGDPSPRDRLVWSMDGGAVQVAVPLSSLAGSLKPEFGG